MISIISILLISTEMGSMASSRISRRGDFRKVVELRSFAGLDRILVLSRLGVEGGEQAGARSARLFNAPRAGWRDRRRTKLAERAARLLSDGEAAETRRWRNRSPARAVLLAGCHDVWRQTVAPLLPEFLAAYPRSRSTCI